MTDEPAALFPAEPYVRAPASRRRADDSGPGEPARKRAAAARKPTVERPKWSAYYGGEQCGRCVLRAYRGEQNIATDPIRRATYRRRYAGDELLLCSTDARHYKDADGGGVLPARPVKH